MTSLYVLTGAQRELQQLAEDGEDVAEALDQIEGSISQKAAAIQQVVSHLLLNEETIDAEISRLTAHRAAEVARIMAPVDDEIARLTARRDGMHRERVRCIDLVKTTLLATGATRLVTPLVTFVVIRNNASVEVTNEAAIPPEYMREKVTRSPDKTAILAEYKRTGDRECVTGARVIDDSYRLKIS